MPEMGLNLCTPPPRPLTWDSEPVVRGVLSRPHSRVQRKTGRDAVTATPTCCMQLSLVKDRAACSFMEWCFLGLFFVVSTPSSLSCKYTKCTKYVASPPVYLSLEMTAGGDRAPLARKQTGHDATRACFEQVGAITRFFVTHPGCG